MNYFFSIVMSPGLPSNPSKELKELCKQLDLVIDKFPPYIVEKFIAMYESHLIDNESHELRIINRKIIELKDELKEAREKIKHLQEINYLFD